MSLEPRKKQKLFEVDEAVNKVRAEVDAEAELIIGAITDENLDGLIRVSIVATALDGQQPEPKSVINMVHRIQNRNPGYTDFTNTGSNGSLAFSNPNNSIITDGANALKIEEEEVKHENTEVETANVTQETVSSTEIQEEIVDENQNLDEKENQVTESSNGLENFDIKEDDTLELFNSDNNIEDTPSTLHETNKQEEEDELEIPAFLRRQKN